VHVVVDLDKVGRLVHELEEPLCEELEVHGESD